MPVIWHYVARLAGNGKEWEKGGNGDRNREENGRRGQGGQGTDKERRQASRAEEKSPAEGERKKKTVGGER